MARYGVLGALCATAMATREKITPVQKVLDMLGEMKVKGEKMLDEEVEIMHKYTDWVDDQTQDHELEIKNGEAQIEKLTAFITKAESDVKKLGDEITELNGDIDRMGKELADATEIRNGQNAEFQVTEQDYSESVDALERAIQTIQSSQGDVAQAASLLQSMAQSNPSARPAFAAFMQQQDASAGNGAPAVAAYKGQSSGVIEMLNGLLDKFRQELGDVVSTETNQSNNFELLKQHLTDSVKKSTSDRSQKAALKGETAAASVKAQAELAEAKKDLAADKKYIADITAEFKTKKATYENNQNVRKEEIGAIAKAIEIMGSDDAAGGYKKHVNLAQTPSSLLQMRSSKRRATVQERAAEFLRHKAASLSSRSLGALALQVVESPFAKVIGMIEDLLAKLKQEAQEEAAHKQWCDEELKANKEQRNKQTASFERLSADDEAYKQSIADMGEKIATLVQEQTDLTTAMKDATAQRTRENEENTQTIADAKAGVKAVKSALVVLREFYDKQESFVQQAPEMKAYSGMSQAKGGVVGMMEVIVTDFSRLLADTEASEKAAASEYESFMSSAQDNKKTKHETEVKTRLDKDTAEFEEGKNFKELKLVEKEMIKHNEYFEDLKPACLEVKVSYEERRAKREEEIESLKGAYKMLAAKE